MTIFQLVITNIFRSLRQLAKIYIGWWGTVNKYYDAQGHFSSPRVWHELMPSEVHAICSCHLWSCCLLPSCDDEIYFSDNSLGGMVWNDGSIPAVVWLHPTFTSSRCCSPENTGRQMTWLWITLVVVVIVMMEVSDFRFQSIQSMLQDSINVLVKYINRDRTKNIYTQKHAMISHILHNKRQRQASMNWWR